MSCVQHDLEYILKAPPHKPQTLNHNPLSRINLQKFPARKILNNSRKSRPLVSAKSVSAVLRLGTLSVGTVVMRPPVLWSEALSLKGWSHVPPATGLRLVRCTGVTHPHLRKKCLTYLHAIGYLKHLGLLETWTSANTCSSDSSAPRR